MNAAADLLRAALEAEDIGQSWLAWRTGLTPKHINQVMQGKAPLSVAVAVRIQRALPGVTAEELMVAQVREQVRKALDSAPAE